MKVILGAQEVLRSRSGFCSGHAPHLFVLGAQEALMLEGAEAPHRARCFCPAHGVGLRGLEVLAGGGPLPVIFLPMAVGLVAGGGARSYEEWCAQKEKRQAFEGRRRRRKNYHRRRQYL